MYGQIAQVSQMPVAPESTRPSHRKHLSRTPNFAGRILRSRGPSATCKPCQRAPECTISKGPLTNKPRQANVRW